MSTPGQVESPRNLMTADNQTPHYSLQYLAGRRQNRIGKGIKIQGIIFLFTATSSVPCLGEFYTGECRTITGIACVNLSVP